MSDETVDKELERDKVYPCEVCNGEYQGTLEQLRGHVGHCRRRAEAGVAEEGGEPESVNTEGQTLEVTVPQSETITEDEPATTRPRETPDRKKRIPIGVRTPTWNAPEKDGFHYRVFNDKWSGHDPARIQKALDAGYEVVEGVSHKTVGTNDDGSPIEGILMRIPQEWYDEDQALKQKDVDRVDEAIMAGTLESKAGDNRYIPDGIKIHSDNREPNT